MTQIDKFAGRVSYPPGYLDALRAEWDREQPIVLDLEDLDDGRPILSGMAAQIDETLAAATLTDVERRTVARLVARLEEELGENLLAVWLYGSRARGDADLDEPDVDLKPDIDLLVIVDPVSGWGPGGAIELVEGVADAEGESPAYYSVLVLDAERLRDRRRIRSFFIQNVDRDKLVLYGSGLE